jgi:alcohol dehydrogenase class IV
MANILYITSIQIDFGVLRTLAEECEKAGIQRPLIVTDQGVKAAGILQKALDALPGVAVAVFDQTPSNPNEAAVRAAVAVYHAHQCDGLVAVGGGSSIDCAKGMAIALREVLAELQHDTHGSGGGEVEVLEDGIDRKRGAGGNIDLTGCSLTVQGRPAYVAWP